MPASSHCVFSLLLIFVSPILTLVSLLRRLLWILFALEAHDISVDCPSVLLLSLPFPSRSASFFRYDAPPCRRCRLARRCAPERRRRRPLCPSVWRGGRRETKKKRRKWLCVCVFVCACVCVCVYYRTSRQRCCGIEDQAAREREREREREGRKEKTSGSRRPERPISRTPPYRKG